MVLNVDFWGLEADFGGVIGDWWVLIGYSDSSIGDRRFNCDRFFYWHWDRSFSDFAVDHQLSGVNLEIVFQNKNDFSAIAEKSYSSLNLLNFLVASVSPLPFF